MNPDWNFAVLIPAGYAARYVVIVLEKLWIMMYFRSISKN
jgi:hypothetical protein